MAATTVDCQTLTIEHGKHARKRATRNTRAKVETAATRAHTAGQCVSFRSLGQKVSQIIVYDPKMEDTCSCPLQTLMVWVVAVDVLIAVCYGWKEALNK